MIFINVLMIFGIKEKSRIFTHTMYFLAISTNIHQRLKIGFVVQGHIQLTFNSNSYWWKRRYTT